MVQSKQDSELSADGPEPAEQEVPPEWAYAIARVLDDAVRIPGTKFGVGLDGLLGLLFPALGDVVGAVASVSLLALAFRMGVPKVVLARMVVNVGVDALVGAVPLLGDVFDFAWRANTKNLALIEQHRGRPDRKPGFSDYAFVGLAIAAALVSIALPIGLVVLLFAWLGNLLAGA